MSNELSIDTILKNKDNYNLALPFQETRQINPFIKITCTPLYVNTDESAGQIYKVGRRTVFRNGKQEFVDTYGLEKNFLYKLAVAAGIQFPLDSVKARKLDENTWEATAYAHVSLPPDGMTMTVCDIKAFCVLDEEKKLRMSYEEKALNGIEDYRSAKDAEKKYRGQWVDTGKVNAQGYQIKKFLIDESDRKRYVEKSLIDAMINLKTSLPQKAATGAKLRLIRHVLGIGTYTMEELKRPFAVARVAFSPDYSDPMVRQMMLQQCMQSMGSMFGMSAPVQPVAAPQIPYNENVDGSSDKAISAGSIHPTYQEEYSEAETYMEQDYQEPEKHEPDYQCFECGAEISERVYAYSIDNFNKPLCVKCQRGARRQ